MGADYQQYPFPKGTHPSSWLETTVGEVMFEIRSGYSSGKHNQAGQGIPHLRPMNVSPVGEISMEDVRYVSPNAGSLRLAKDDILFTNTSSTAWVGKTAVVKKTEDWGFSNHMTRLRVADGISPEFVALQLHYLRMSGYFAFHCKKHINQSSIAGAQLAESVPFRLPPAKEQQRIVAKLHSLLDRERRLRQQLDELLSLIPQYQAAVLEAAFTGRLVPTEAELARKEHRDFESASVLLERILVERRAKWEADHAAKMSRADKAPKDEKWKERYEQPVAPSAIHDLCIPKGWTWASVEQCSCIMQYGTSAKTNDHDDGIPVLRMGNIIDGRLRPDNLRFLPEGHSDFPELFLQKGDVLFNRTNSAELVGKTAVFKEAGRYSFASYLIRLRFLNGCSPEFVAFFINSTFGRLWVASVAGQVTGQANISGAKLAALAIPLPPSAEQKRIVVEVEHRLTLVVAIERQIRAALEETQQLRASLFHHAMSGKLAQPCKTDEPAKELLARIRMEREKRLQAPKPKKLQRKAKMQKLSPDLVKDVISKLPKRRFSFHELSTALQADYDPLKVIIFELLGEPKPALRQVFNSKAKTMQLERIKP